MMRGGRSPRRWFQAKQVKIEVFPDANAAARLAAARIAEAARTAVAERDRFTFAVSGGRTPRAMLRALAGEDVPWSRVQVLQVDERVAPEGDPDRNLTHLREDLLSRVPLRPAQIHAMAVEDPSLAAAAARYARTLSGLAGSPPVLDLIHLGLGADGHAASLVPGDPVLGVTDAEVGVTGIYRGRRRMTLTYPVLNRARRILWFVTGSAKAQMLLRLSRHDPGIPAGRICGERAVVLADPAAAGRLGPAASP
jgi:6-phosphogluconolactonase